MNIHKKITISFLPSDSDLWDFIEIKKETCNLSEYIRSLIRKEILNDTTGHANEKAIQEILQLLTTDKVTISSKNKSIIDQPPISDDTRNTINNLF